MSNKNLFIDIHAIQTVPPSNLNRDDTGSPKTAIFGDARRARVSSQSWKKAMRDFFVENGVRTLFVPKLIADKVRELRSDADDKDVAKTVQAVLKTIGGKGLKLDGKDSNKLAALAFVSRRQIADLARLAVENSETPNKNLKKDVYAALMDHHAYDMALFGRMIADDPSINIDAAAQVAHAIGVGKVRNEFDFYTGTDDAHAEDNAGAGMMGTIEFDSSVLYRYADISLSQLQKNLPEKEDAIACVKQFIDAFIESLPTGKQNSFAANTLPSTVVIEIRDTRPIAYTEAFVKPIENNPDAAAKALVAYARSINRTYDISPVKSFVLYLNSDNGVQALGEPSNEKELSVHVANALEELL